jgi:UDP-glucose-4-epimerase GalE
MAKVLVVGGAGYIGSHVAKDLTKAGHEVMNFDNLSTGHRELVKYGSFTLGNILFRDEITAMLERFKPDAVMHFAARALVGESVQSPALYYESNVMGSFELIDAVRRVVPNAALIFSSTCSLYAATEEPLSEINSIAPMNPYARTKRMVEEMLADYAYSYGLKYVVLRYFNAAGADPAGELGEWHEPETHLIPRLLLHVLDPVNHPVQIFGKDYPTPDGTCIRDYVHVSDLADAHRRAMEYLFNGGASDIFNLGTTKGSSVLEVIRMVEKITGKRLNIPVAERRVGDPSRLVAGSKKALGVLGWRAQHDLESIVKTAWAWAQKSR